MKGSVSPTDAPAGGPSAVWSTTLSWNCSADVSDGCTAPDPEPEVATASYEGSGREGDGTGCEEKRASQARRVRREGPRPRRSSDGGRAE